MAVNRRKTKQAPPEAAAPQPQADDDDRWSDVEDALLHKTQAHQHAERRWKYFAK